MLPSLPFNSTSITHLLALDMARIPLSVETRRQLYDYDRRWPIKLGLRALAIPFAFIAMILFAATTSVTKLNYGGNDWTDGLPLAPVSSKSLQLFCTSTTMTITCASRNIHVNARSNPSVQILYLTAYLTLSSAGPPCPPLRPSCHLPHSLSAPRPAYPSWLERRS